VFISLLEMSKVYDLVGQLSYVWPTNITTRALFRSLMRTSTAVHTNTRTSSQNNKQTHLHKESMVID